MAEYTITLTELEDNLLLKLANSQGDILEDIELIENLEETKKTALDIEEKVSPCIPENHVLKLSPGASWKRD